MPDRVQAANNTHDHTKLVKEHSLDDFAERLDSGKIFRGLLRRIWIVILFAILFTLGFVYLSHRLASRFVASAYLLYEEDPSKQLTSGIFPLTRITKASAVEMVKLPGNLNAVRSILGLDLTEKELAKLVDVVPPSEDSNLININVTSDNPSLAIDVANTLAAVVVKGAKDYSKRQVTTAYEYYKGQLANVQRSLTQKVDELTKFEKEHPSFEHGSGGVAAIKNVSDLELRKQAAFENYNTQVIQYENLRREAERIPDQIVKYSELDNPLKQRLGQAELTLIEAKTRYAPENPKIKTLEAEIAQLKQLLQDPSQQQASTVPGPSAEYTKNPVKEQLNLELLNLRGKLRSAQKLKEDIDEELAKQTKALTSLPEEQVAYNQLLNRRAQIEYDVKQYEAMVRTAEALMNLGKSGIEVYQNADKAFPNDSLLVWLLPLIGLFLGTGFGLFVALAVELSDRRLRTQREVQAAFHLRCLTTIPEFRFFSRASGEIQLQYFVRTLEESLERHIRAPHFSLALLSSHKGEGKSTLAYFLARYYQELGKPTLIIEMDGPSQGIETSPDAMAKPLEAYLRGEVSADEIILPGEIDRIQAQGDVHMKELLKGDRLRLLLEELRDRYAVILIDTPGLLDADYAVNIAEQSDHSLFILGSTKVPLNTVEIGMRDLENHGVRPAGIVLNRALRIYLDDVRIKSEARRAKVGLLGRLFGWFKKGAHAS